MASSSTAPSSATPPPTSSSSSSSPTSTPASASAAPSNAATVAGWVLGSVGSSVGLILVNKVIMKSFGFTFVLTLTALHFLITSLGMEALALLGFFTRARLPPLDTALMAVFCIGSVAFMNFSLAFNSVGFYQVTKLLCIPCMVLLQTWLYGQTFSAKVKLTLTVVLAGVGLATVSDVELNTFGCVMGALAVLFTAQFQIWQGAKQGEHKMNAMQMNHAQALPSFLFCLLLSFFFDHRGDGADTNVRLHQFAEDEVAWILLSCVLALSVNLCTYGLIGKTSAVTYQVVGHAKTCLILLGGFLFFPPSPPPTSSQLLKNLCGIAVALVGVVFYSQLKIAEGNPAAPADWCDALLPRSLARWMDGDSGRQGGPVANPKAVGYELVTKMEEGQATHK